jgi:capsular exopolysaccharide synthesis family protein
VSSSVAGDGKTSTAANLAVAAARVGLRTLLVDADLRRSTIAKRFGMPRGTGLSDLLLSGGSLVDQTLDVGVDNLRVLPAGTVPPNPNELLASPAMQALHHQILSQVDLVIYDTPAVLAVPDALELGRHVDFAVLVGRAGSTGRRQLQAAIERLTQVGTDVAGTVLNDISGKADGYYYAYYYAEDTAAPQANGDKLDKATQKANKKANKKAAKTGAVSDSDQRPEGRPALEATTPSRDAPNAPSAMDARDGSASRERGGAWRTGEPTGGPDDTDPSHGSTVRTAEPPAFDPSKPFDPDAAPVAPDDRYDDGEDLFGRR